MPRAPKDKDGIQEEEYVKRSKHIKLLGNEKGEGWKNRRNGLYTQWTEYRSGQLSLTHVVEWSDNSLDFSPYRLELSTARAPWAQQFGEPPHSLENCQHTTRVASTMPSLKEEEEWRKGGQRKGRWRKKGWRKDLNWKPVNNTAPKHLTEPHLWRWTAHTERNKAKKKRKWANQLLWKLRQGYTYSIVCTTMQANQFSSGIYVLSHGAVEDTLVSGACRKDVTRVLTNDQYTPRCKRSYANAQWEKALMYFSLSKWWYHIAVLENICDS